MSVHSTALLDARPDVLLPDGRNNPEYQKWWRAKNPEKYRAQLVRNNKKRKEKEHDQLGRPKADEVKCYDCGITIPRLEAIARGWNIKQKNRGICNECS